MLKIVINTDADFTPAGKRTARVIKTTRGSQLRFYVSGRIYRWLAVNAANIAMANEWLKAGEAA